MQVHTGTDDKATNDTREARLKQCGCRAITYGNDIYVQDGETNITDDGDVNPDLLSHELTHAGQYQSWGPARYYLDAGFTQGFNWLALKLYGENEQYELPNNLTRKFSGYGMEQQAEIVRLCHAGITMACGVSPYQFPHQ